MAHHSPQHVLNYPNNHEAYENYRNSLCPVLLQLSLAAQGVNQNYRRNWHYSGNRYTYVNSSSLAVNYAQYLFSEGNATISDAQGGLLFYTDGMSVFDRNNNLMDNGDNLFGSGACAQPAIIVPMPGNVGKYYIFTTQNWYGDNLYYSVVDMAQNSGLGKVITKNIFIYAGVKEQVAAIRKPCGSEDFWIVTHQINSKNYLAFLLTSSGLTMTPVISNIGGYVDGTAGTNRYGCIKFAHNSLSNVRNMVSVLGGLSNTPAPSDQVTVELCDFNVSTGKVSKAVTLAVRSQYEPVYGAEFSPDNTRLYVTQLSGNIIQYNIVPSTVTSILLAASGPNLIKGPADQIYINNPSQLMVMNNPNALGNAVNITPIVSGYAYGIGTGNFYAVAGCPQDTVTTVIPCANCIGSFAPPRGRSYVISAWVKEENAAATKTSYTNPQISITYINSASVSGPFVAKGRIIDGWQRIEETFTIPAAATDMIINLKSLSGNIFVDDVRIYPLDGSCKTFVYDPVTLRAQRRARRE